MFIQMELKMEKGAAPQFNSARVFAIGVSSAALAVALGAFGAHALRSVISPQDLSVYETGVRYQMYHALALLATALGGKFWAPRDPRNFQRAGLCFTLGTVLFSGSLYFLCLSGTLWVAYLTPIGGMLFFAGWIFLLAGALKEIRTAGGAPPPSVAQH
jgi:uncharacterized membrane protein YgdD (TMEM256/DUF423 family)